MKVLIIGQNTKIANIFGFFADEIHMVIDAGIPNYREYEENARYHLLSSSTNTRTARCVFKRSIEIMRWVRRLEIDVIFTNEKYSMLAAKLAVSMLPGLHPVLLTTSHNSYAWNDENKIRKFSKAIRWSTDGYVALASFVTGKLLKLGMPRNRVLLLPNALEEGLFIPKTDFKPNRPFRIVYTAVINEMKGHHVLIRALHLLKKNGFDVTADFYGEITDRAYLESVMHNESSTALACVNFKGRISNMELRGLLKDYDAYVSPTYMEMSPFNILEAQQAGLPIIATNVGGIPDLVEHGVSGLLVEPKSAEALAEALTKLIRNFDIAEHMAKAGWVHAQSHSPEKSARKLHDFIKSLR